MIRRQPDHINRPSRYPFPPFNPSPLLPGEWERSAARPVPRGHQPASRPQAHGRPSPTYKKATTTLGGLDLQGSSAQRHVLVAQKQKSNAQPRKASWKVSLKMKMRGEEEHDERRT